MNFFKPKYLFVVLLVVLFSSCRELVNPFMSEKVVASVDDKELKLSDIESIFTDGITPADSIKVLEAFVDAWVKKQLKVIEAEKLLDQQQDQIDQMVEDYRNSLLNFRLDQYFVDKSFDSIPSQQQLNQYYEDNRAGFVLDRPIVKGVVVKFPDSYRQTQKLKDLMRSTKESDRQDFVDICMKNIFELHEFNRWIDFADVLNYLPTVKGRKYDGMLDKREVQEMADSDNKYFVLITDLRSVGDEAPMERVVESIKRVLYIQRKQEIIRSYEDSIYRSAVENNRIINNVN